MQQQEIYERARLSRDSRFDGQFFVGVRTTGIYCRPICPAVAPKSENVAFFATAAAAGEAGFRPCLRCRPECAPGTPAWNGTSTTVQRGLRLISSGALDDGSVEDLSERLGVTSRHLRRLFTRHLGASPQAVAHTQRLHFAKRLIDQTNLPMAHIAVASGFGSVRRFNDAFRRTYGRAPRELRRHSDNRFEAGAALTVQLGCSQPFDWNSLLGFLGTRATPGVEQVVGSAYLRTVSVGGAPGVVECRYDEDRGQVILSLHGIATSETFRVVQQVRDLLDLDAPVTMIGDVLRRDPVLASLSKRSPGMRVPGAWDGFELAVRAILGQQVSVQAATTLAGRVVERYGQHQELPATLADRSELALTKLFPTPEKLQRAHFNGMGIVNARIEAIRGLARAVTSGDVDFDPAQDADEFRASLTAIRGIGDWTAQYVAMRALKNPDAFPASDLGLIRAFGGSVAGADELLARSRSWRPWRAYAALLLWNSTAGSGG